MQSIAAALFLFVTPAAAAEQSTATQSSPDSWSTEVMLADIALAIEGVTAFSEMCETFDPQSRVKLAAARPDYEWDMLSQSYFRSLPGGMVSLEPDAGPTVCLADIEHDQPSVRLQVRYALSNITTRLEMAVLQSSEPFPAQGSRSAYRQSMWSALMSDGRRISILMREYDQALNSERLATSLYFVGPTAD